MITDPSSLQNLRPNPAQEFKLAKPAIDLYVGQVLKTVVVTALTENQVTININGQNINAKTSHHFSPGELMKVQVMKIGDETILKVIPDSKPGQSLIQTALAQNLPYQVPPGRLLAILNTLTGHTSLPSDLKQQISQLLANISSLTQLPRDMAKAVSQSGLFLEAALLNARNNTTDTNLRRDMKAQYLVLLKTLAAYGIEPTGRSLAHATYPLLAHESLPLKGAVPQPQPRTDQQSIANLPVEKLLSALSEQAAHVLARIKTFQIAHAMQSDPPYSLMLDLPVQTESGPEAVSLMIKEERQEGFMPKKWSISFALNLSELGDIQGAVSINNTTIDVQINAEKPDTLDLLASNEAQFSALIEQLGLQLGTWGLHQGLNDNNIDGHHLSLLDLKI
ncbi:flagellar hook-length control protein FliK [Legionella spiritensis]|uniref:flagellar hook-length control protein FliK n=1 Tax=Legionella spiritensis TaxID=452 RepID=UPI000F6C7F4A|nr:flagellar hook-length control protein FliK [Legionella spiritensis]VEG91291.1 Flagellar hook-length control protein FliK [Legionella spiritensis]